jgi:hypothetical protein
MVVPPISKALIEYLEWAFPDKLPESQPRPGEIELLVGHQQVIRHLRVKHLAQAKTVLAAPQGST